MENEKYNHVEKIVESENEIFSINFLLNNNSIRIESKDIDSNKFFVKELILKDWIDLNKYFSSFHNISNIFEKIEKLENNKFQIINCANIIKLKIIFEEKYQSYPVLIALKELKPNKEKEINNNNIIEEIAILKNNNKDLKERIKMLEVELEQIKFSLPFNLFDNTLYKLENIYKELGSFEIISKREDLGLINSGIKYLYNKNIKDCLLAYKFVVGQDKDLSEFWRKFKNRGDKLIIVKTMNNRTFGFFYNNQGFNERYVPYYLNILETKNYKNDSFILSFDNRKIYYSNLFFKNPYEEPNFSLKYDNNKKCFFGKEYRSYNYNTNNNYMNDNYQSIIVKPVIKQEKNGTLKKNNSFLTRKEQQITKEIQPMVQRVIQPVVQSKIQPIKTTEIQPIIIQEVQPIIKEKITPIKPVIQPIIREEKVVYKVEEGINQPFDYEMGADYSIGQTYPNEINIFTENKNNFVLSGLEEFIISNLEIFEIKF